MDSRVGVGVLFLSAGRVLAWGGRTGSNPPQGSAEATEREKDREAEHVARGRDAFLAKNVWLPKVRRSPPSVVILRLRNGQSETHAPELMWAGEERPTFLLQAK